MKFKTINPATEEPLGEYDIMTKEEVDIAVGRAKKAFEMWKGTSVSERSKLVKKLGRQLTKRKELLAKSITEEMGKPIKQSVSEAEKCASICEYFGKNGKKFLKDEHVKTEFQKSYISFQPLGVVGSIMPWNFPASQIIRFAVPSLIAGNVQIVKPSSTTPNSGGLLIEEFVKECKFPEHVFQTVIGNPVTGTALVESRINAVSLTGSTEAGMKVAQLAMKDLKKVVLELGGSDPFIVLEDADMDKAIEGAIAGRFLNCGQSCTAAKRFIVLKEIANTFTERFVEKAKEMKVGNPMDQETEMGPLAREEQRKKIEEQLSASISQGAKLLLGGKRLQRSGYFFQPTIIAATNDMAACSQEAFGPLAPVITAENEDDAIRIANDSQYGLGASLWTENRQRGEAMSRKIDSGCVFVNKNVRSDPRLPFGGTKKSGIGREFDRYGLIEMTNIKSVIIN